MIWNDLGNNTFNNEIMPTTSTHIGLWGLINTTESPNPHPEKWIWIHCKLDLQIKNKYFFTLTISEPHHVLLKGEQCGGKTALQK